MYLNVVQSPIPYTNGGTVVFTVTKSNKIPAPYITFPANVTPTVSQVTTLDSAGLEPRVQGRGQPLGLERRGRHQDPALGDRTVG